MQTQPSAVLTVAETLLSSAIDTEDAAEMLIERYYDHDPKAAVMGLLRIVRALKHTNATPRRAARRRARSRNIQ